MGWPISFIVQLFYVLQLCPCRYLPEMWRFLFCKRWKEWKKWLQRKIKKKTLLQETMIFGKVFKVVKECCYFRSSLPVISAVNAALTMRKNSWLSSFVFICTTKPHLFISSPSFKYQNKWNEIPKTKLWFRDELRPPPLYDSQTLQMLCILIRLSDFSFTLQIYLIFSHVPSNIVKHKSPAHFSLPPTH